MAGAARRRITVALALGDGVRGDRLGAALGKDRDFGLADAHGGADILVVAAASFVESDWAGSVVLIGDPPFDVPPAVRAILPEDAEPRTIVEALRLVSQGFVILHDQALAEPMLPEPAEESTADPVAIVLTPREREVLHLLAAGASNKLIARRLGVSIHTAKFHVASLLRKLGASGRLEAVGIGLRTGLAMV
jgi:DNA-binding CsgD family transcriptional regulator